MKKFFLSIIMLLICCAGFSQLRIETGANWVTTGNPTVVLEDMSFANNGNFNAGAGTIKLTGNLISGIAGTSASINLARLEIAKSNLANAILGRNINVNTEIKLTSGILDIGNYQVLMSNGSSITGETETSRVTSSGSGFIQIVQSLNSPNAVNAGNLGAIISSTSNLGSVTIRRYHVLQSGTGLNGVIRRSYSITPQNNATATLRFQYFDAELSAIAEENLSMYQSTTNGTSWSNQSFTSRDANLNFVEKAGLASLSLFTLGNSVAASNGVTGLVFSAKLGNQNKVTLNWSTATETNMQGYEIQRRLDNEAVFSNVGYAASNALNGNSNTSLSYVFNETNAYAGTSFYRLKIIDKTSGFTYSSEQSIKPKGKGKPGVQANISSASSLMQEVSLQPKLTVGPNPNNGYFFFSLDGISKTTAVTLFTMDGKMIGNYKVNNAQRQQVSGLKNGMYILRAEGMEPFKVMVQGSSANVIPASASAGYNNKY